MPANKTASESVADSVDKREHQRGEKRIVVSAFVDADRVDEAKAAMRKAAKKYAAKP